MTNDRFKCDDCGGDISIHLNREDLREVVKLTVAETFLTLGLDASDPIEVQKDFQSLREWRESLTSLRQKGMMTMVGLAVAGLVSALVVGMKVLLRHS